MIVHGLDFTWLEHHQLQLTDAPVWYSLRARILGELCGYCDLDTAGFGCQCPPSEPVDRLLSSW